MLNWTRAFSTGLLIDVANMAHADFIISAVTSERATLVEIVKIGILRHFLSEYRSYWSQGGVAITQHVRDNYSFVTLYDLYIILYA